ncbi:DNA methyltransferase, partial [Peptostreptococcus anaerobius]
NGGFLNHITVKMSDLSGPKMAHVNKKIPKIKEHILIYQKDSTKSTINVLREPSDWDSAIDSKRYTQYVEKNGSDDTRNWEYTTVRKKLNDIGLTYGDPESYKFLLENADCVFRSAANNSLKKMSVDNNFDTDVFTHVKTETGIDKFVYKNEEVIFASSKLEEFNGKLLPSESISDIWLNFALNDLSNEGGGVNLKNGKKPESLLKRIVLLTTQPNDIVLDFFMGTATTQAVALKLNRKFIGIEQMDYIKEKSIKRLVNVIKGEDRGISKSVNWQGGGSFVYCELLEDNESLISELQDAKDSDSVKKILNKAINNGKLIPSVLPSDLKESQDEFDKLSLDEQKNIVMELLNKNQLYVNLSDIDDEDYKVSEADKAFTISFYGKE